MTERENLKSEEILIFGDRLESDIAMAEKFGSPDILISPDKTSVHNFTAKSLFHVRKKIKNQC